MRMKAHFGEMEGDSAEEPVGSFLASGKESQRMSSSSGHFQSIWYPCLIALDICLMIKTKPQMAESRHEKDPLLCDVSSCWINHQANLWIYCSPETMHFPVALSILVSLCLTVENILTEAKVHKIQSLKKYKIQSLKKYPVPSSMPNVYEERALENFKV